MKHVLLLVALLLLVFVSADRAVQAQGGCGLKPLKPLVPLGCRDLALQCMCDVNGKNCHWEWLCVQRK